jgi:hypothetical protein
MYEKSKIYTIRCRNDESKIYVGSTTQPLKKRFQDHKAKALGYPNRWYKDIEDWNDWYIELYEEFPCQNKDQLLKREGEITRLIGTLNKNVAGRTTKEWMIETNYDTAQKNKERYEKDKEKLKEEAKEYRLKNKESFCRKILCECGMVISADTKRKHINKSIHKKQMEIKNNPNTKYIICECGMGITEKKHLKYHQISFFHQQNMNFKSNGMLQPDSSSYNIEV